MVLMGTLPPLRQVVVPQPLGCEFDVGVLSGATRVKVVFLDLQMIPVALSLAATMVPFLVFLLELQMTALHRMA